MFLVYFSVISLQSFLSEELISPFTDKVNTKLIHKFKTIKIITSPNPQFKNDKRSNLSKAENDSPSSEGHLKYLLRMKQPH